MQQLALERATQEDVDWAFDAVEDVSRTFALTIDKLDPPISTWICSGYLLCRIADTIEDASHIPPTEQVDLLRMYDDVLDEDLRVSAVDFVSVVTEYIPEDLSADWDVVVETERVLRVFREFDESVQGAMRPVVREMVSGMAEFIDRYAEEGGLRVQNIEELEDYCWYVAGTVGEMITNLLHIGFGVDPEPLRENEQSFALLLQLVNIAKDVPDDYQTENNVYLPAEWLAEVGVEPDGVMDTENTSAVATVVSRVTSRARGYTDGAYQYLMDIPEEETNMMEAFSIPYLLALGTLRELEANTEQAVETRDGVKVSRDEVFAVLTRIQDDFTKEDLAELSSTIPDTPLHTASSY